MQRWNYGIIEFKREKMIEKTMEELDEKIKTLDKCSLTITHHPLVPETVLKRISQLAFEYFKFDAFLPILSQQALITKSNRSTGLVVELSHSAAYCIPFYDNEPLLYSSKRLDVGGRVLTSYLKEMISDKWLDFRKYLLLTQDIKEKVCKIDPNFKQNLIQKVEPQKMMYILPDYDI